MASDLAGTPISGLRAQICGDAHLSNFGVFGSPERHLVFDVNDFDETLPGPFEWDVKRLAASLEIAGRDNGFKRKDRRAVVLAATRGYREAMRTFAGQTNLEVWYAHLDMDRELPAILAQLKPARAKLAAQVLANARTRDSMQAFKKLARVVDGKPKIISDPPLIVPITELFSDADADDALRTDRGAAALLPPNAPVRPQASSGGVHPGGHGPQGGRRRQRRYPRVDPADGGSRPARSDLPSGQGGPGLRPRRTSPGPACTATTGNESSPVSA